MTHPTEPLILIVEDDFISRRLMQMQIKALGYTAIAVADAELAVAVLGRERPQLVFTDLHLPGADGWALVRRMKADPSTRDIPVIAVTVSGYGGGGERRARETGCDAYLHKPVNTATLAGLLEHYVGPPRGTATR